MRVLSEASQQIYNCSQFDLAIALIIRVHYINLMNKSKSTVSSEQRLVDDLVALMESSELPPWRKPWTGRQGNHRNLLTGKEYRGANPLLLQLGSLLNGLSLPLWIGYGQAKTKGWIPRKGCKAVRITSPKLSKHEQTDGDGKPVLDSNGDAIISAWVSYKTVCVFNAADLVGITPEKQVSLELAIKNAIGDEPVNDPPERLENAEAHLEQWQVPTTFGGARACYSFELDCISMPEAVTFHTRETFCSTWLHEQAHSTGHKSRLDRKLSNGFGSIAYAREELIAELASVLACYRLQIGYELEMHAAYLLHWSTILKEGGAKVLFDVLSEARKAADLIAPEPEVADATEQ